MRDGLLIREWRRGLGLSQSEVADMAGVSASTVSRIENGGAVREGPELVGRLLAIVRGEVLHLALVEADGGTRSTVCGLAIGEAVRAVRGADAWGRCDRCPDCDDVVRGVMDSISGGYREDSKTLV